MGNCTAPASGISRIKRELTITTHHGDTFTVSDTDDCSDASLTLAQFKNGGIMTFVVEGAEYYVPASSVDSVKVEIQSDSE